MPNFLFAESGIQLNTQNIMFAVLKLEMKVL